MNKKAFTIIELLVVVAIMGILAIMVNTINFSQKTDAEKRDRMASKVASLINAEKLNAVS